MIVHAATSTVNGTTLLQVSVFVLAVLLLHCHCKISTNSKTIIFIATIRASDIAIISTAHEAPANIVQGAITVTTIILMIAAILVALPAVWYNSSLALLSRFMRFSNHSDAREPQLAFLPMSPHGHRYDSVDGRPAVVKT